MSNVLVAHEVSPQPPRVGQVTITLNVTEASGKPVTGAGIRLEGSMSHPGMVPVFADASETAPGRYVSTMELSMAGDWHVVAHLTLPDSRRLDHQFEIKAVGPASSSSVSKDRPTKNKSGRGQAKRAPA